MTTQPEKRPAVIKTCPCKFTDKETERTARRQFLKDYGDQLPDEIIEQMVSDDNWDSWVSKCNCDAPKEIVAASHYEPADWYLCHIKGLAVKSEWRGKGLGREIAQDTVDKTSKDPQCLVLGADITYDNIPSLKSLKAAGFEPLGEFCWEKGQKPANILHLIRFKPTKDNACLEP